jgi:hypothetical protein
MFYQVFAAVPEWAPPAENHILYSESILKNVSYATNQVRYTATNNIGPEYLRLAFKPTVITVNGSKLPLLTNLDKEGYTLKNLGNGDYAVTIRHKAGFKVTISISTLKNQV